jgi:hypothetical protein
MRLNAILLAVLTLATANLVPIQEAVLPAPNQVVSSLNETELRQLLTPINFGTAKITFKEEKDSEGLTAFYVYEDEGILLSLYQYSDQPGGPVNSLGLTVGNRLARAVDVRKINDWNSKTRYVKAYVDSEGDAILSSDLLLSPGVTKLTIQEWIRTFAKFSREFTDFLKK